MPFARTLALTLLLAALCGLAAPGSCAATPLSQLVADELRLLFGAEPVPSVSLDRQILLNASILPRFYRERNYRPAWINDLGLSDTGRALLDVLRGAADEGLCPEDYHLGRLEALAGVDADPRSYGILFDPGYMGRLDLLLSDAFLLYVAHLSGGRVDPVTVHEGWRARRRQTDLSGVLAMVVEEGRPLAEALAELGPPGEGFQRLREALAGYRRIAALGGWPQVPPGPVLRSGARDGRLPALRQRLVASGDLAEPALSAGILFDAATEDALRHFQERHGLDADGVLGAKTLVALNVSVEARIRQLELNLERQRWLPWSLGRRHLLVDVADFRLKVVEEGRTVMTMAAVVGTAYRKTPVFSARMTYLEFAPYWSVPPTILREDKLPLIRSDPGWLARHHYEIVRWEGGEPVAVAPATVDWGRVTARTFPGTLRQKPGPWNPLGRVKFMFPNRFAVYLHDTPDRHLFARDVRSYSSGCIRIERPVDLAQYLLEGKAGWDCERILAEVARSAPLQVGLPQPLPVHVLYRTAWVAEDGSVQFREDVYLRDLDLQLALDEARSATAGP